MPKQYGMVVDLQKCVGCGACALACKTENNTQGSAKGQTYNWADFIYREEGKFPNVSFTALPVLCNHCSDAPCVKACPVTATYKDEQGVVVMNYDRCIGCRYCLVACPYGARSADIGHYYTGDMKKQTYEVEDSGEYGKVFKRKTHWHSPIGNARKCHFCIHRVEKGELTRCTTTCLGHATYFGDLNDPKSLISRVIAKTNTFRYREELGTEPRVIYIV